MIRNLQDAEAFLNQGADYSKRLSLLKDGRNYRLDRISAFLDILGHPEDGMRVFHVAGSKGKGTVCYVLASLLESGYNSCGLFLSPYVYDFRERFCRPFSFFSNDSYIAAANEMEEMSLSHQNEFTALSVFEKYLAFCIILFKREGIRNAVFETGLGGRLDATNALHTDFQLLTSIEMEHAQILGKNRCEIAVEKSKIIKRGCQCFALNNGTSVDDVFKSEAARNGASIAFLSDMLRTYRTKPEDGGMKVALYPTDGRKIEYFLPLTGKAFAIDSALAVLSLKRLGLLSAKSLSELPKLRIPGRFETVRCGKRTFVFDGAHTQKSISGVLDSFLSLPFSGKRILVFGCAIDKKYRTLVSRMLRSFDLIVIQKPGDYKASDPDGIYSVFESKRKADGIGGVRVRKSVDPDDAARIIACDGGSECSVLITGSFYLLSILKKSLFERLGIGEGGLS